MGLRCVCVCVYDLTAWEQTEPKLFTFTDIFSLFYLSYQSTQLSVTLLVYTLYVYINNDVI